MAWYDNYPRLLPQHKTFLDSFEEDEYNELVLLYYYDRVLDARLSGCKVGVADSVEWFMNDNRFIWEDNKQ